jgi:hypothetical protein
MASDKLISLVYENRCLWDVREKNYLKRDIVCAQSRQASMIREDHSRHPHFFTPTGDAHHANRVVDLSDVCWKTCFVFATHVRPWPADNYRACAAFLSVCVISYITPIPFCTRFSSVVRLIRDRWPISCVCVTACSVNASFFRYCRPRGHFRGLASLRPVCRAGWLVDSAITVHVFHELAFVRVRQFPFECVSRTSTCFRFAITLVSLVSTWFSPVVLVTSRFVVHVAYASSTNLVLNTSHPSPQLLSIAVCWLVAVLINAAF